MSKEKVTVVGVAPYAVCLPDGGELSQGQTKLLEFDFLIESMIRNGLLGIVEKPEPAARSPRSKQAPDATETPTEGETE